LIRPWRSASSKLMGPELDAETATHDDVLLPVYPGAHRGTFLQNQHLLSSEVPCFEVGQSSLIIAWRSACSKFMGPERDAATATHDDMLLPVDVASHMGTFLQNHHI
jgi:hypothetical protein